MRPSTAGKSSHPLYQKILKNYYQTVVVNSLLCLLTNQQGDYIGATKRSPKTTQAYQQHQKQSGKPPTHNFNFVFSLLLPLLDVLAHKNPKNKQLKTKVLNHTNNDQIIRRLEITQKPNIKSNPVLKFFSKWLHYSNSPGEKDFEIKLGNPKTKCYSFLQIDLKSPSPERQTQRLRLNRKEHFKSIRKLNMADMEVDTAPTTTKQNTQSDDTYNTSTKKSKATSQVSIPEVEGFKWWLGFSAMEAIARDRGLPICLETSPIADLMTFGWKEEKAKDIITTTPPYGRVPQILYLSKREDGMPGQHYNLTQVPSEVETDEHGFSLDYQVEFHFEKPTENFTTQDILSMTVERLAIMEIPLGRSITRKIQVKATHQAPKYWTSIIKVHLLNPEVDGVALLRGKCSFILNLDYNAPYIAKVCKSFDAIARGGKMSIKFDSPFIKDKSGQSLFLDILVDNFKRGHKYEIPRVNKQVGQTRAWIMAPSPMQAEKIEKFHVAATNEIIQGHVNTNPRLSDDDKAKNKCITLVLFNLNQHKTVVETTKAIYSIMGEDTVNSIFYPNPENGKPSGVANVECKNPIIYMKHVNKNYKLLNKYVDFTPHGGNLLDKFKPAKEDIERWGYNDINNTLVNTINAVTTTASSSTSITKEDVAAIIAIENMKLKTEIIGEMSSLKEVIITEAKTYTKKVNGLRTAFIQQMAEALKNLNKALGIMNNQDSFLEDTPSEEEDNNTVLNTKEGQWRRMFRIGRRKAHKSKDLQRGCGSATRQ
jgi:hypothetical protein